MAVNKILVVDDEATLAETLKFNLELEGFEADTAASAEEALRLDINKYNLILLDVMMEGMDGFEFARLIKGRADTSEIPIIFVTAKGMEEDMVSGLNLGADDYIAKPFSVKNVIARVRAVLRRGERQPVADGDLITYHGLRLNRALKAVWVDGREVNLPRKEFDLLCLLMSNRGRVFTRQQILDEVWERDIIVVPRTVDVNITRIRQKIGPYGVNIVTRAGYGYTFVE